MGYYLDWYRRLVCQAEGHTHGEEGELDCILMKLAQVRAEENAAKHATKATAAANPNTARRSQSA